MAPSLERSSSTPDCSITLRELGKPIANNAEQDRVTGASGGDQSAMNRMGPIVSQQLPRQSRHHPAGFVHQKISRRKVPVVTVGGGESAVERPHCDTRKAERQRRNS